MPIYQFTHAFQDIDTLSADRYVNTFHCQYATVADLGQLASMGDRIKQMFNNLQAAQGLNEFWANHILGPGAQIKAYNLSDPEPRLPVYTNTYTPSGQTALLQPLPTEVSVVCSFSAALISGGNVKRRRGRIYLGPLNTYSAGPASPILPCRPSANMMDAVTAAYANLITSAASVSWTVGQYSRVDAAFHPIASIFCDNAYDTQRRRGLKATTRVTVVP